MVGIDKIWSRLQRLERCLARLKQVRTVGWDRFSTDADLQDIADRNLEVAVQCCVDMANHMISSEGMRFPDTSGDAFVVLSEEAGFPTSLALRLKEAVGMRNVLIHEYLDINHRLVYEAIGDLEDFRQFAAWVNERVDA